MHGGGGPLLLYVEAEEQFLVSQVETAGGNDGMRPDLASRAALLGLGIQLEATVFFPT